MVANWPLFDNVLTERLALYVSLATAVIVALWTAARPPGLGRWLLPALLLIAMAPNPGCRCLGHGLHSAGFLH